MEQDLLNYLDQRFSSIAQHFDRVDQRFDQVDQRFDQVDQRFQETGQQIQALREETAQRFDGVNQRFDEVDQRLEGVDQRIGKLEEEIRGAYVLIEALQSEVRLVAADGILNLTEQLNRHREEVALKFSELEFLNRRVFEEFRDSQQRLEGRVTRLEATG